MTLKCVRCGMDFPSDIAKCKNCKSLMVCMDATCACQSCGHQQESANMWCQSCLDEEMAKGKAA